MHTNLATKTKINQTTRPDQQRPVICLCTVAQLCTVNNPPPDWALNACIMVMKYCNSLLMYRITWELISSEEFLTHSAVAANNICVNDNFILKNYSNTHVHLYSVVPWPCHFLLHHILKHTGHWLDNKYLKKIIRRQVKGSPCALQSRCAVSVKVCFLQLRMCLLYICQLLTLLCGEAMTTPSRKRGQLVEVCVHWLLKHRLALGQWRPFRQHLRVSTKSLWIILLGCWISTASFITVWTVVIEMLLIKVLAELLLIKHFASSDPQNKILAMYKIFFIFPLQKSVCKKCRFMWCSRSFSAVHWSQVSICLSNKPNDFEGHIHNHRGGQYQAD